MGWDMNLGFNGNIFDLLENIFSDGHYPSLDIAESAQDWVKRELLADVGPFVIRHSADVRQLVQRKGPSKPRYYFSNDFPTQGLNFDLIASDNEANTSFFSNLLNPIHNLGQLTMHQALQQFINVGIVKKDLPILEKNAFIQHSILGGMNNHHQRPALSNLKLCHFYSAGENFHFSQFSREQIQERSFRLLTPLNVYPFPDAKKYTHKIDGMIVGDIGEEQFGIESMRAFLYLKYHSQGKINALKTYYSFLQHPFPSLDDIKIIIQNNRSSEIQITPKEAIRSFSRDETDEDQVEVYQNPNNAIPVYIDETSNGRFHLKNFGVIYGGQNRDRDIFFVIRDRSGNLLKQSRKTNCIFLGIAANGRGDYDANQFRQSDIVMRNQNGQIVPNSAIGRRIPWI